MNPISNSIKTLFKENKIDKTTYQPVKDEQTKKSRPSEKTSRKGWADYSIHFQKKIIRNRNRNKAAKKSRRYQKTHLSSQHSC